MKVRGAYTPNKIRRPAPGPAISRQRLFARLDEATGRPVLWLGGPPGCGKSTLLASYVEARGLPCLWYRVDEGDADPATLFHYLGAASSPALRRRLPHLTPEYRGGLRAFSRRYFEALFQALPRPSLLVFDDFETAQEERSFCLALEAGVAEVPEGICVAFAGRGPLPSFLTVLRARQQVAHLRWEDLRLTTEESAAVVRHLRPEAGPDEVERLSALAGGWVAGLVAALDSGGTGTGFPDPEEALGEVFRCYARALLDTSGPEHREFLLKVAFLPHLTPRLAAELSGARAAGDLLRRLWAGNYFLERAHGAAPVFRFHPLLRDFLRSEAEESWGAAGASSRRGEAARLLAREGLQEDAAVLFIEARDWPGLVDLAVAQAPRLVSEGRSDTLARWLAALPAQVLRESAWASYWAGTANLPETLPQAREQLAHALVVFRSRGDGRGALLAATRLVESHAAAMDGLGSVRGYGALLRELLREGAADGDSRVEAQAVCAVYCALVLCQAPPRETGPWEGRARSSAEALGDARLRLTTEVAACLRSMWGGDFRRLEEISTRLDREASRPGALPLAVVAARVIESMQGWLTGQADDCCAAAREGLRLAGGLGIHQWDDLLTCCEIQGTLVAGDLEGAQRRISELATSAPAGTGQLRLQFEVTRAWHAFRRGDVAGSLALLEASSDLLREAGSPYHLGFWNVGMAYLAKERGDLAAAGGHLAAARGIAADCGSLILEFASLLLDASLAFAAGRESEGIEALRQGFGLGRREGYAHCLWWDPNTVADLCARALEEEVEPEYAQELIRRRRLWPRKSPLTPRWPWALEIRCLGAFEIRRGGAPLTFGRKVPRRTLDLLKALISLGAHGVREVELCAALWPDKDGDVAHLSFTTTLHRLRRLLAVPGAILWQGGRLSLSPDRVWLDVMALEQGLREASALAERGLHTRAHQVCERSLSVYRGEFLPGEEPESVVGPVRRRLRERYARSALNRARALAREGDADGAVLWSRKALEADPSPRLRAHLVGLLAP